MNATPLITPSPRLVFAACLAALCACTPREQDNAESDVPQVVPATSEDGAVARNEAAVTAFYAVYNTKDYDSLDAILAPGFRHGTVEGLAAFKEYMRLQVHGSYENVHLALNESVFDGDVGAAQWTLTLTEAATGRRITLPGMSLLRFQDGRIMEHRPYYDPTPLNGE